MGARGKFCIPLLQRGFCSFCYSVLICQHHWLRKAFQIKFKTHKKCMGFYLLILEEMWGAILSPPWNVNDPLHVSLHLIVDNWMAFGCRLWRCYFWRGSRIYWKGVWINDRWRQDHLGGPRAWSPRKFVTFVIGNTIFSVLICQANYLGDMGSKLICLDVELQIFFTFL